MDLKIRSEIEKLYKSLEIKDEFEASFFNLTSRGQRDYGLNENQFKHIIENGTLVAKNNPKLEHSLHIIYTKPSVDYRIEVNGLKEIKKYSSYLKDQNKNVVYRSLLAILDDNPNLTLLKKIKDKKKILDSQEYNFRVRVSKEETKLTKEERKELENITYIEGKEIIYRRRQRIGFTLFEDKNIEIKLDATCVQSGTSLDKIPHADYRYEAELELVQKTQGLDKKYLNIFLDQVSYVLKTINQTNILTSTSVQTYISNQYQDLVQGFRSRFPRLSTRNPYGLNVKGLLHALPDKYAVTDKADGERYFMLIVDNKCYFINNMVKVTSTDIKIKKDFNNTILDGEYIFIPKYQKYIYMAFDILFYKGEDIRKKNLKERIEFLDKVTKEGFNDNIPKDDIRRYYQTLDNDIKREESILVRRKIYLMPTGRGKYEIYQLAYQLWNTGISQQIIPYELDGLIFTPIFEVYRPMSKKEYELFLREFKWKPLLKLSIDFYIKFKRNPRTGEIDKIYDNSIEDTTDQFYYICYLFVGKSIVSNISKIVKEEPVEFNKHLDMYITHIPLKDNKYLRDEEGYLLKDETVVEFIYDISRPDKFRWVPIRTRYDKTNKVKNTGRGYGNREVTALDTWEIIKNPIIIEDFKILGNPQSYHQHFKEMKQSIEMLEEEGAYYQLTTDMAKSMRSWHNWIKRTLTINYCKPVMLDKKTVRRKRILDYAVGRGGEVVKYFRAGAKFVVGVDIDQKGLTMKNGAIDRYQQQKQKFRFLLGYVVPDNIRHSMLDEPTDMEFVHADLGYPLKLMNQNKVISNMPTSNKKLIREYFDKPKKFDVVNCQFAIHYFFGDKLRLDNFLDNVNDHLANAGYFIFTAYDAHLIFDLLRETDKYEINYVNNNGENITLLKLTKLYTEKDPENIKIGTPIDVLNPMFSNVAHKEYLVNKNFIIEYLFEKYGYICEETDLFKNLFKYNEVFFRNTIKKSKNVPSAIQLIWKLYQGKESIDKESLKISNLNRYYVFRKPSLAVNKEYRKDVVL